MSPLRPKEFALGTRGAPIAGGTDDGLAAGDRARRSAPRSARFVDSGHAAGAHAVALGAARDSHFDDGRFCQTPLPAVA